MLSNTWSLFSNSVLLYYIPSANTIFFAVQSSKVWYIKKRFKLGLNSGHDRESLDTITFSDIYFFLWRRNRTTYFELIIKIKHQNHFWHIVGTQWIVVIFLFGYNTNSARISTSSVPKNSSHFVSAFCSTFMYAIAFNDLQQITRLLWVESTLTQTSSSTNILKNIQAFADVGDLRYYLLPCLS